MPRGDGTGPNGLGPMTGQGRGFCAGYANPFIGKSIFGRDRGGMGFGRGRGFRNRLYYDGMYGTNYNPVISKEEEINILKNQAKNMQGEIKAVNDRINELEKETS